MACRTGVDRCAKWRDDALNFFKKHAAIRTDGSNARSQANKTRRVSMRRAGDVQGQQPSRGYPRTPLLTFVARLWIPFVISARRGLTRSPQPPSRLGFV